MIRGRVIFVGQPTSGTSKAGKPWSKQIFAVETEGQYPKKVAFGVMNGKFAMNMGDVVEIEVDADSREYQGKWYTELTAWRCNNISAPSASTQQQQNVYQQTAPQGYVAPQYPQNPVPAPHPGYAQPYPQPNPTDDLPF